MKHTAIKGSLDSYNNGQIEGWAYSPDFPARKLAVDVYVDGRKAASGRAAHPRKDLIDAGIGDGAHAYRVLLPPQLCDDELHEVDVRAVDTGVPLFNSPRKIVLSRISAVYKGIVEYFDEHVVAGWAWNERNADEYVEVEVEIDGVYIGTTVANGFRKDLKEARVGKGDKAFRLEIPHRSDIDATLSDVTCRVKPHHYYASSENLILPKRNYASGQKKKIKGGARTPPQASYEGYVFGASYPLIKGWAWTPSLPNSPVEVEVEIGGRHIVTVEANEFRKELLEAGKGDGKKAFTARLPQDGIIPGRHDLVVRVANSPVLLRNCPATIDVPTIAKKSRLQGRLEKADQYLISGWVWDPARDNEAVTVEILVDDEVIDVCVADIYREDLEKAGKGRGCHGFRLPTPPHLSDGIVHKVRARVSGSDYELTNSPCDMFHEPVRPFANVSAFWNWSLLERTLYDPLKESDYRILGYMSWMRDVLAADYGKLEPTSLVSIIMPAFNREDVIRDAIVSVINQSYPNWELIVVDDGSEDSTCDVVRTFRDERIKLIELPHNVGVSAARNVAMEAARGEVFAYLDSDNTWEPDFLLIMTQALIESSDYETAYCGQKAIEYHKSTLHGIREIRFFRFGPFNRSLLENRNYLDLNCFVHKRESYDRFGGFSTELRRLVDWDLILRYTVEKAPLAIPVVLSNYFFGKVSNQITSTQKVRGAELALDASFQQGRFRLSSLATVNSYGADDPDYEFFPAVSAPTPSFQRQFTSIIIVSYEVPQYLDYCIASVFKFTKPDAFELIIVDNNSSPETKTLISRWAERHDNIKTRFNDDNVGFTLAVNQGIEMARGGSDIILLNNDSVVTEGWVPAMQDVLQTETNVGLVAPRQVLLPRTKTMNQHVPFGNSLRELDVTLSVHHSNVIDARCDSLRGYIELSFAPFFCIYITRECLKQAGYLNARDGRHYRSDRLYCDAVREYANKRIIYTPHSKLYHFLQKSTSNLKASNADEFKKIFKDNAWTTEEKKKYRLANSLIA